MAWRRVLTTLQLRCGEVLGSCTIRKFLALLGTGIGLHDCSYNACDIALSVLMVVRAMSQAERSDQCSRFSGVSSKLTIVYRVNNPLPCTDAWCMD